MENRNAFTRVQCLCILALATLLSLILPTSAAAQMTRTRRVTRRLPPLPGGSVSVAFGPKVYSREAGPPNTFTDSFIHCGTGQQCQIVVMNGNADGSDRISSASISVNGVEIIGPSDFNQNVDRIVKPVVLKDNNELTIRLASKPGGFLTVEVECASGGVTLSAGDPGASRLGGALVTALPIQNDGTAAAD